jgi:hypothetical protein
MNQVNNEIDRKVMKKEKVRTRVRFNSKSFLTLTQLGLSTQVSYEFALLPTPPNANNRQNRTH